MQYEDVSRHTLPWQLQHQRSVEKWQNTIANAQKKIDKLNAKNLAWPFVVCGTVEAPTGYVARTYKKAVSNSYKSEKSAMRRAVKLQMPGGTLTGIYKYNPETKLWSKWK